MKYFGCKADAALYLLIKPHWLAYLLLLSYLLHSKMWIIKLLLWTFLLLTTSSAYPRLLYTTEEILRYRSHYELPAALHFHREILRCRPRYIHRGSQRNFCVDHNGSIPSLWTVGPRKSVCAERPVDRSQATTIIPVPKKSSPSCFNDYRPVALTPIPMKCFERLVMQHIKSVLPPSPPPWTPSSLHIGLTARPMMPSPLR